MAKKYGPEKQTVEDKRTKTANWKQRKKADGYKLVQVYLPRETMKKIEALHPKFGTSKKIPRLLSLAIDSFYANEIDS